ncbi:MAG: phosphatidylglycerophosphatase A [Gammaproteobacteria bacterium]|nr:MAG: phosphatidylglycerophosphatase A [Gammaproteobacteria bacterium]
MIKKTTNNPSLTGRSWYEKLVLFFAFGLGSGFLRPAPGTWGTLPGVALAAVVMHHPTLHVVTLIVVTLVGTWLCQRASDILGVHDHSGIVIDEIAGILLTMLFFEPSLLNLTLGFVLFRLFDIVKPWPIKWIDQRIDGGWGIMLDDLIAGVFAWLSLYILVNYIV